MEKICIAIAPIFLVIPFLFLDGGKGYRIVQNGSRQERMSST